MGTNGERRALAGDWSSAAFILYLDKERLERDAVAEANAGFSDSEPDSE